MRTPRWRYGAVVALLVAPLGACAPFTAGPPATGMTPRSERPTWDRLLTPGEIQIAEAHLQDFGYDPGPVDGIFTAQTQTAVRAFQARYGLPISGLLDRATRMELVPGLDDREMERR
jgi:peptidoglycan hydrolase-like protein with peptidoglycan-binding domain